MIVPDISARPYRWWTCALWWDEIDCGIKLGPMSIFSYVWLDGRRRVSVAFHCQSEHIMIGGPLAERDGVIRYSS